LSADWQIRTKLVSNYNETVNQTGQASVCLIGVNPYDLRTAAFFKWLLWDDRISLIVRMADPE
jgi:hypothetical protein